LQRHTRLPGRLHQPGPPLPLSPRRPAAASSSDDDSGGEGELLGERGQVQQQRKVPQVIFCSRTHSQLSQFVGEQRAGPRPRR
jgi:hypothetical protein